MFTPSAANQTDAVPNVMEWLLRLATATNLGEIKSRLTSAFQKLRSDKTYHLVWHGAAGGFKSDGPTIRLNKTQLRQLQNGVPVSASGEEGSAWTVLPLLAGSLRGWLILPDAQPGDRLLLPLALQTAALLATFGADELAEQLREQTLYDEIGQTLSASLELEPLLQAVYNGACRVFGAQKNLFIALHDHHSGLFRVAAHFINGDRSAPVAQWTVTHGLTGVVIRQNAPLLTDSYMDTCAVHHTEPLLLSAAIPYAWAGVPMRHGDRVLGVLAMYENDPSVRYTAETLRRLEMLAHRASANFEQTRLYERTVQQARQLSLLNELGRALTATLDFEAVPSLIMGRVQQIMQVEEGSLLLLDEDTGELVFSYSLSPFGQQLLGKRLPPSVGIAGLVMRTGQSLIANGAAEHPAFYTGIDSITGHQTRDLLCVPLLGPRGVQGVIEIINHRNRVPFTPEDRTLLEAVADQAVVAIENANLYTRTDRALARRIGELDQRNKQLHEILQIGNALKAASDLYSVLPQLAEAVRTSTRFNQVVIGLVETQTGRRPLLRRVAAAGIDPAIFAAQQTFSVEVDRVTSLLKPIYQRGAATYYIDHRANGEERLWNDALAYVDVPELRTGSWHPNDTLFTVLYGAAGEILGLLSVAAPTDGRIPTDEQIQTLEIFANQLVVALENGRLYDQLRQSLQGLTALSGLGMAINTTFQDSQAIWQFTVGGILDSTGALGAGVLLIDGQDGTLAPMLTLGKAHLLDQTLRDLASKVVSVSKPLNLVASKSKLPPGISEAGGQALLLLPLLGTRDTIGALYVWYPDVLPSAEDQDLITLFAGQAAVAVENLRLDAAVREGRDRLASILASTEEAILLLNTDLTIVEANATLGRMTGTLPIEDWLGKPIAALLEQWQEDWQTMPEALEALDTALQDVSTGEAAEARGQVERSGSRAQWLQWTALPVRSETSQRPHPLILVLRDITATVEAENLRQDLTYMMIHDLRGPLSSVMTSLDMLFKQLSANFNEGQDKILRIAIRSSRRLLDMVNLLLDISKLEAGQMPINPTPTPLSDVVRTVAQSYEPLLAERKVDVAITLPAELPLAAIDPETIERVVQNLLDNAIKYSPPNSTVSIAATAVAVAEGAAPAGLPHDHPPGEWLLVSVRDAGPGIPQAYREKIFVKFAQVQKAGVKGTGLGLTYCKLAVETHGGRIWVGGDDGPGATFFITLPAAPDHQ